MSIFLDLRPHLSGVAAGAIAFAATAAAHTAYLSTIDNNGAPKLREGQQVQLAQANLLEDPAGLLRVSATKALGAEDRLKAVYAADSFCMNADAVKFLSNSEEIALGRRSDIDLIAVDKVFAAEDLREVCQTFAARGDEFVLTSRDLQIVRNGQVEKLERTAVGVSEK